MREILFRGKRTDNGAWVEGAFCLKDCDDPFGVMVDRPSIIKYEDPFSGFWFRVDPETVGQYTGLTDKNGKRIFEGDIVRISVNSGPQSSAVGVVRYVAPCFIVEVCGPYPYTHKLNESSEYQDMGATTKIRYEYENVGNVFDSPELLARG